MLYSGSRPRRSAWKYPHGSRLGPLRTGTVYGIVAVAVAFVGNLYFLALDPARTPDWVLAVIHEYHTQLALAAFVFLGILAALRTTPTRLDEGVPYRSLLLRDCALAATVVAVLAGVALLFIVALEATLLSGQMQSYAQQAAPKIVAYVNESRQELSNPPPPAKLAEVRDALQPPQVRDLGRSISNFVLRALLIGTTGGVVGILRGRKGGDSPETSSKSQGPSEA